LDGSCDIVIAISSVLAVPSKTYGDILGSMIYDKPIIESFTAAENTMNTIRINANFATRLFESIKSLMPKPPLLDEERPASLGFEKLDVNLFKNPPLSPLPLSLIFYYYNGLLI